MAMDANAKLAMLKVLVGIADTSKDAALAVYLDLASRKIIDKAYPYDNTQTTVPSKYEVLQCEIAAYLWSKRGAEGELSHNENGISRSYESADVPRSMLKQVVPFCGLIPRGETSE